MKITLPLPPNRANARWFWRTEKRKKTEYYTACLARYGKLPERTFTMARIDATLYTHQEMDVDNLYARAKWTLDWLVIREYVEDDAPYHLTMRDGVTHQAGNIDLRIRQQIDRGNQRIEIELEEITA